MRIELNFSLTSNTIPADYRRGFLSFFKNYSPFYVNFTDLLKIFFTFGHSRSNYHDLFKTIQETDLSADTFPADIFTAGGVYQTGIEGLASDDENRGHFRTQTSGEGSQDVRNPGRCDAYGIL